MSSAKNFLDAEAQKAVLAAIADAEKRSSGEIRVHIEDFCMGDPVAAATKIFGKLGMHETAERSGVLIYIATNSRKIAVIGDKGIHEKLGTEYWERMVEKLIQKFKARSPGEGLVECIREIGSQLSTHFPLSPDDRNELSNDISFGS